MVDQFQSVMFRETEEGGTGGSITTVTGKNCADDAQRLSNVPFAGRDLPFCFKAADKMIQSPDSFLWRSFGDLE
jgi:hypothetical protein